MLEIDGLDVHYGPAQALYGVSLNVGPGELVALIGANGAGKTSLVNAVCGLQRPTRGTVTHDGRRLDRMSPEAIVRSGVVQVAEGRQLFPALSIEENLRMGAYTVRDRAAVAAAQAKVLEMFPILAERRTHPAQSLSGGQQQMLAIGRALMSRPKLMIFDEPSLGLAPVVVQQIFGIIAGLNRDGMPVLLIEQNVALALRVSHRAYVLEQGRVALSGPSSTLRRDPHIASAYLGI